MDEDRQALNEKILAGSYLRPEYLSSDLLDLIDGLIEPSPARRATLVDIK
jgi:hypothetical protein